jgi:FkbM family methyltransferase
VKPSYGVLRGLELGARVLRRAGLGRAVDRARERLFARTGPFSAPVGDAVLCGSGQPHMQYVRQLRAGREGYEGELLLGALRPGDTLLDVGAFLGYFTQLAARRGARVVAVEPNPASRGLLERGLGEAGLAGQVRVIGGALSSAPGEATLFLSGGGDTASLHDHETRSGTVTVRVLVGDEALDGAAIDVVKIDVEGGEVEALRGLARALAGVRAVCAECNPPALRAAGAGPEALEAELRRHGFEVRVIDEDARRLVPWAERPAGDAIVNLWAQRA